MTQNFDWKPALLQLFSATVNQQTLEEAAELMVSVSAADRDYHEECLATLNDAIRAAEAGDEDVIICINKSGYQVSTFDDAIDLLNDFLSIYLEEYQRSI